MILTFRPIKVWPEDWNRTALDRHDSPFRATYSDTLQLLDRKLEQLGASNPVLQVDASERDVRIDGQLRANATVNHPGVILSFDTHAHGTLTYACDRFQKPSWRSGMASWQHNLRAIALGLEALRKVERYGIANRGQQYAGYRELGSGIPMAAPKMTVEEAARLLAEFGSGSDDVPAMLAGDQNLVDHLYRLGAKEQHPDVGGDPELFKRLTEARDLLRGAS